MSARPKSPRLRVVNPSPHQSIARQGEIHCPQKRGILAIQRCEALQRETALRGRGCTCDFYRSYSGHLPTTDDGEDDGGGDGSTQRH